MPKPDSAQGVGSSVRLNLETSAATAAVVAFVPNRSFARGARIHHLCATFRAENTMRSTGISDVFYEMARAVWAHREQFCFSHGDSPMKVYDMQVGSLHCHSTQIGGVLTQQGVLA